MHGARVRLCKHVKLIYYIFASVRMRSVGGAARVVDRPLPYFALSEVPKVARLYDADIVRT